MCHSCASRNPDNMASYFLDSRFRGNDTLHPASLRAGLFRSGRGELLHSAKMLPSFLGYLTYEL